MTVDDLVRRLSELPGHLPVIMPSETDLFVVVGEAFEDLAEVDGGKAQLADEREDRSERVVRLFGAE